MVRLDLSRAPADAAKRACRTPSTPTRSADRRGRLDHGLAERPALSDRGGRTFGLGIGTISSLLGVAGGEVIIPTLVIGYGVPIALAGTLSLLVSLPTIVVGIARHWRAGAFANAATTKFVILPLAFGALFGAPLGGLLAAYAPAALRPGREGELL